MTPASVSAPPAPTPSDCGPRSLLFVCENLHVPALLETLKRTAGTTEQGTSMQGLARAAHSLGLTAKGVQVSRDAWSEVRLPALAWVHGNHYLAVLEMQGDGENARVRIHDPNALGETTITREDLQRMSGGYLLLISR